LARGPDFEYAWSRLSFLTKFYNPVVVDWYYYTSLAIPK